MTEREQQERCVEYFKELLNNPEPSMELQMEDAEIEPCNVSLEDITATEIIKVIKSLKTSRPD